MLYSVTAAVVVGLVAWVAVVLASAKEPWARATAPVLQEEPREPELDAKTDAAANAEPAPETEKATSTEDASKTVTTES